MEHFTSSEGLLGIDDWNLISFWHGLPSFPSTRISDAGRPVQSLNLAYHIGSVFEHFPKERLPWFSQKIKEQSSFPPQPVPSSHPVPFLVNLIQSLAFILTRSIQHWMHKTWVCWCCQGSASNKREGLAFILLGRKCLSPRTSFKNNSFHFEAFSVLFVLSGIGLPVLWRETWIWCSFF